MVVVPAGDPVVVQGVPVAVVPDVLDEPPAVEAVPGAAGAALPAVLEGLDPAAEPGIVEHGVPTVDPFAPAVALPVVVEVPGVGLGVVGAALGVVIGVGVAGVVVPACGVAAPAPGVAAPVLGVAVPTPGPAVPAGGVAVVAGGVAVPAGGTTAPGVEACPAVPPAVGVPPAGAVCATIQLAQPKSNVKVKSLRPDISILHV